MESTMSVNPFLHDNGVYSTKIDPIAGYINKSVIYLMRKYGIDKDTALKRIREILKDEYTEDPIVTMYERDLYSGDKEIAKIPLSQYLRDISDKDLVIAPSFTAYYKKLPDAYGNIVDFESIDAGWTRINAKKRGEYKKKMKHAKALGNNLEEEINNVLQKAMKIKNNSLSGVYSLQHLPIATFSAHYSLTSTTRMVSGVGNMISERVLAGNRFYRKKNDVMAEFLALLENMDKAKIKKAMDTFNLKYPTITDVVTMVLESSHWYWKDESYIKFITDFLKTLDKVELAGILFSHDLFSINRLNSGFIRQMTYEMSRLRSCISDDVNILYNGQPFIVNLTHHACEMELRGKGLDYSKLPKETQDMLVSTYLGIEEAFKKYDLFIDAFFRSLFLNPINIGSLKEMVRKKIVLSDTDSTCATYFESLGEDRFDSSKGHIARSAVFMVFVSETSNHLLKILSANLNAKEENWGILEMKPEYTWISFIPANVSKHYMNGSIIEELIVREKPNISVSGVNLHATNIPKKYKEKLDNMIEKIMFSLMNGEMIDEYEFLGEIAKTELEIIDTIKHNPSEVLKFEKIKGEKQYSLPWNRSNYFHYKLYKEVFASKYGDVDETPIATLKLPLKFDKVKDIREWVKNNFSNKFMADKFIDILDKSKKQSLGNLKIPHSIASVKGVPEELIPLINYRRIVLDNMKAFYIMLEAIGVYIREDRLLIEDYPNIIDVDHKILELLD
jgi:hypothetical protein